MAFTLYDFKGSFRAQKALIAAAYGGVEIEVPAFNVPADCNRPEFKTKNPVGKVPVLETPEGTLFESNAILRHIARLAPSKNLLGSSWFEQGLVDQWIDFSAHELEPCRAIWLYPIQGFMKFDAKSYKSAKADVRKCLDILEAHLATRTFLVGNSVTLADISVGCALAKLYELVFDPNYIGKYTNVTRYVTTLLNQPEWVSVIGKVEFCKKETKAPQPKQQKKNKGKQQPKKEKKEKKEPVALAKPKAKKPKNPLDLLPKSKTMDMDGTKRLFSNNTHEKALEEFWANWDAEGYCLYTSKYNYEDENTSDFMTCNLVGGWLQRLESLRKYGMGVVCILGEEDTSGPFPVRGAWLFRGTEVPFEMKDCPDSEYHTLTKVDLTNAEQKKLWEDLVGLEKPLGMPIVERKWFK